MKSPVPIAPAAQSSVAEQKRGFAILDSERWLGPLLIGPAVIYIFLLVGVPFFMALYYSVSNTTTGGGTMGFVGLRNFTAVIERQLAETEPAQPELPHGSEEHDCLRLNLPGGDLGAQQRARVGAAA